MTKLGPYELNSIITGDARELSKAIPDESIDLIFTDPVYDRIEDYEWLAETAVRVLRPDGACLVWTNGRWCYKNARWLDDGGLHHRWTFGNVMVGGPQPMNGKIIAKTNRVLWFDVYHTSTMVDYLADGLITGHDVTLSNGHKWGKSPRMTLDCIKAFTRPGAIVFDPFTGGGTVPAVCKMLNRNYLAFEIDPNTAELARQRVRDTQPPLPIVYPEQAVLI